MTGATSMKASILIEAQTEQAKREMAATGKAASDMRGRVEGAGSKVVALGREASSAATGISGAANANRGLTAAAREASAGMQAQADAARRAAGEMQGVERATNIAAAGYRRLAAVAGTGVGMMIGAVSLGAIAGMADTWSDLSARVGLAVGDMGKAEGAMARLGDIANATYSSITLTTEGFLANSTALTNLGYAYEQQLDYLEAVNNALVISGAKGERAAMVSKALSDAMALGKLSGDQLNTVLLNGDRVARLIADRLGVTTNELRKLGSEGKITGEIIYSALVGNLELLRVEAETMPATIEDGVQRIQTNMLRMVGTFDQATGASASVAQALILVADNLDRIAVYAAVGGTALTLVYGPAVLSAAMGTRVLAGAITSLQAVMARFPMMLAIMALGEIAYRLATLEKVIPGTGDALDLAARSQDALNDALATFNQTKSPEARANLVAQAQETRELAAAALAAAQAELTLMQVEAARFAAAPVEERGMLTGDMVDKSNAEAVAEATREVARLQAELDKVTQTLREAENADIASPISRATTEASKLANELARALGNLQSLQNQSISSVREAELRWEHRGNPVALAGALEREKTLAAQKPLRDAIAANPEMRAVYNPDADLDAQVERAEYRATLQERLSEWQRAQTKANRSGGGKSKSKDDATGDLIRSLQRELDILRELDPVQQELIRHRDALAGATEAERGMVEELIRTRIEEADALERVKAQMEDVRALGHDVVRGLVQDLKNGASAADIFANVLDRVADKLLDMGATGIADVLFGAKGGSGGGLLGGFLGSMLGIKMNAMGDVIGAPTLFAYGDKPGQLGMMGEAGEEAIIPLTHAMGGGVGAVMDGRETTLGLTRLSSGKLGVEIPSPPTPFAMGGTFGHVPAPPPVRPSREDHARTQSGFAAVGGQARLLVGLAPGLRAELEGQMEGIATRVSGAMAEEIDRNLPARVEAISHDTSYRG